MANASDVLSGYTAFLQKITGTRVANTLSVISPTFDFLLKMAGHKQGPFGLGRPESGDQAFGRVNGISRPNKEKAFRERVFESIWKQSRPTDTNRIKKMAYRDSVVAAPHPGTGDSLIMERFIFPRWKFSRTQSAATLWHDDKRTAFANATTEGQRIKAIGSLMEVEDTDAETLLCEDINNELFGINGKSGAPSSETVKVWDSIYSISNALATTGTYAGIDRSDNDNAEFRGNVYSTAFTGSFESLIDHMNYKLFADLGTHGSTGGLMKKSLNGVQLLIVGADLMIKAKNEARSRVANYQIKDVPDPVYGFTRERVEISSGGNRVHVLYDPSMDSVGSTYVYGLNPQSWSILIPSDRNFTSSKIINLKEAGSGGEERDEWFKELDLCIACEVPCANVIYSNVS